MGNKKEIIEKFEKSIIDNKNYNTFIYILYNMSCHKNFYKLNFNEKYIIMNLIYDIYMNDEQKIDIGVFSDVIMDRFQFALNGKINKYNIYDIIYMI